MIIVDPTYFVCKNCGKIAHANFKNWICVRCSGKEFRPATQEEIDEYEQKESEYRQKRFLERAHPTYAPKCPVCGSPNIHKISATKRVVSGAALGLLSKTARSQWECSNCGNKW